MKKTIIDIIVVTIGTLVVGLSFNIFFLSQEMVISGGSGIAIILDHLFEVNPALFILITQVIALICGLLLLDKKHVVKSIYGTFLYPFAIEITSFAVDIVKEHGIDKGDFLMFIITGSVISGIAYGYIYRRGYTTGGSDILVQIMNKYLGTTIGTSGLLFNASVIVLGGLFLGFEKVLYAVLIIFINTKTQDLMLLGNYSNKLVIINTKKREKLKDAIKEELHLELTQFHAKGGFLNHKNDLLMCFCSNTDYYDLKEKILEIDPDVFFVVTHAYEYNMRV